MRLPWHIAGIWDSFRKNWRVPADGRGREFQAPHLVVRQLEERRVLTVGAGVAVAAVVEHPTPLVPDLAAHADAAVAAPVTLADHPGGEAPTPTTTDSALGVAGSQGSADSADHSQTADAVNSGVPSSSPGIVIEIGCLR